MPFGSEPAAVAPAATPAPSNGQAKRAPNGNLGNRASSPGQPHPCGRPVDGHIPVVVAETGPLVAPLLVVAVAPASSGGAVPEVNLDKSVNYLDITVCKGTRFRRTGKADTRLYTKPSNHELHLTYTSLHLSSTFSSILHGQHKRSLVASTSMSHHVATMVQHIPQQSISHRVTEHGTPTGNNKEEKNIRKTKERRTDSQRSRRGCL